MGRDGVARPDRRWVVILPGHEGPDHFFVVSAETSDEFVAVLGELYPVHRSSYLKPRSLIGFGDAARWAKWIEKKAFAEAMEGRSRGRLPHASQPQCPSCHGTRTVMDADHDSRVLTADDCPACSQPKGDGGSDV